MIAITHSIGNTDNLRDYAKGRLRVWLNVEPSLTANAHVTQGLQIPAGISLRLRDLIKWEYDFALVTYSGDSEAIGIKPHRDARFDYWSGRQSFGKSPNLIEYDPRSDAPTDSLNLTAGDVVKFNCKNLHSATPSKKRWNINFWRKASQVRL